MRLKLLTLALALVAAPLTSHSEDLLEAYQQARANDPVLAQAEATRRSVGEGVPQALSVLLPQVNGTLSMQQVSNGGSSSNSLSGLGGSGSDFLCSGIANGQGTYNCSPLSGLGNTGGDISGHSRTRSVTASLNQVIFNLADISNLRAARSTANAQDLLYTVADQNLYVRVATAYFGVLTSQDALTFAKASEDSYRQSYEQSDQQFKVGISAITDVYSAKASYEAAKAATVTAENNLNDAKEALTQITGKPVGALKKLRDDLPLDPPMPNDLDTWVKDTENKSPQLLADQQTLNAAEHDIMAARSGHLPSISATLSRGKDTTWLEHGSYSGAGNGRYGTTIGVTLTVPIFSGGAVQSHVRQSIDQRDSAQDQMESDRRLAVRNTLNYFRSVVSGISEVQSGRAAVDSGQKALEATKAGFSVGTKTMTDVLLAIQNLTSSESTYSQSRHQFVLDRLLLKQSAGTIEYNDLESVNALLQ